MRKVVSVVGGVALVAAVPGVAIAAGGVGAGSDNGAGHVRLVLLDHTVETGGIDNHTGNNFDGSTFTFHDVLSTPSGRAAGTADGEFTVTASLHPPGLSEGTATATLRNGSITVQGVAPENATAFSIAVTGGTGRYEGAGGTLTVHQLNDTNARLVFELLLPHG